jgi:hypothetical protein
MAGCGPVRRQVSITLHEYEEKMSKFLWWWEEYTGFGESIGLHPRLITRRELRLFLTYLRESVEERWGTVDDYNNKRRDRLAPSSIERLTAGSLSFFLNGLRPKNT